MQLSKGLCCQLVESHIIEPSILCGELIEYTFSHALQWHTPFTFSTFKDANQQTALIQIDKLSQWLLQVPTLLTDIAFNQHKKELLELYTTTTSDSTTNSTTTNDDENDEIVFDLLHVYNFKFKQLNRPIKRHVQDYLKTINGQKHINLLNKTLKQQLMNVLSQQTT